MTPEPLDAELFVSATIDDTEVDELMAAFAAAGFRMSVRTLPVRRGDQLTWLVLASLPLSSFLGGLGTSMADDVYVALTRLARRVLRRQGGVPDVGLVLEDRETGTRVLLEPDLPGAAYTALTATLAAAPDGTLRWDRADSRWTDSRAVNPPTPSR